MENQTPDIIDQVARDDEQRERMRAVWDHVGAPIWQLLFIARNQNAQKLATITNHGSLEARRCKQFIFSADVVLGIFKLPEYADNGAPVEEPNENQA